MDRKTEAVKKIEKAAAASDRACREFGKVSDQSRCGFYVNGYGILRDPSDMRTQLIACRAAIEAAEKALSGIDWPTDDDYNQV